MNRGTNLPPSTSSHNDTPRSASRVLNSLSVQKQFRASGRITSEDTGESLTKGKRKAEVLSSEKGSKSGPSTVKKSKIQVREPIDGIRHGETLGEYNRRVEATLRPEVSRAMKQANALKTAHERRKRSIRDQRAGAFSDDVAASKPDVVPREFAPIPAPRRLNDIVHAPPVLPHLRKAGGIKGVSESGVFRATGRTPLNMGQMRILEEERERVIKRYREMKEAKLGANRG